MAKGNVYIVGGSKGGVGKSLTTMILIDYLTDNDHQLLLIDSDDSNPDVYKAYNETINSYHLNFDNQEAWIECINLCDKHPDHTIIINTAARTIVPFEKHVSLIRQSLDELDREFITLWLINAQLDSLQLLARYREAFPESITHVIRNSFFGDSSEFTTYNDSNIRTTIEKDKGLSVTLDVLANRVVNTLYNERLTIEKAGDTLSLGDRAELSRWKGNVYEMFEALIG